MVPFPQRPSLLLSASPHAHHAAPPAQLFLPDDCPVPHLRWHPPRVNAGVGGGGRVTHHRCRFSEGRPPTQARPAPVPRVELCVSRSVGLIVRLIGVSSPPHLLAATFHPRSLSHLSLACNSTCLHPGVESSPPPPSPLPLILSVLFGVWKPSSDDAIFQEPL